MIDLIETYIMGVSPSNVGSLVSLGAELVITLQQGVINATLLSRFSSESSAYSLRILRSLVKDIDAVRSLGMSEPWMSTSKRDAERIIAGLSVGDSGFRDGTMTIADLNPQDQKRFKSLLDLLKDWQLWINRAMSQPRLNTSKMNVQELTQVLHSQCSAILYQSGPIGGSSVNQAMFNPARDVSKILHYLSLTPDAGI